MEFNNEKKLKWFNRLTTVLVIVFFGYFIFKVIWSNYRINNHDVNYTVGEIYDYRKGAKVGPSFLFFYTIHNKKYISSVPVPISVQDKNLSQYIGERFIVKYNVNDINNNRFLYDYPIPDTVKIPVNGWEEIPKYIVKREIELQ